MKLGVIGTGYWGKKHVEEYKKLGYEPFIYDINETKKKSVSKRYQVPRTQSIEEMINHPEIRGISICTPNGTHYDIAKQCLKNEKHVLLEKPMTLKSGLAFDLADYALTNDLILSVGHIYRFNNSVRFLKDLIDADKMGEVYLISLNWSNLEPIFYDRDVLFDLAPHPFDIVDYLFQGEMDRISCIGKSFRKNHGEEAVFVNGMVDNVMVHLRADWVTLPKTRSIKVTAELGTASVNTMKQTIHVANNGHSYDPEIIPNNTIQDELRHFIGCIKGDETQLADGRTGAKIIETIELAKESLVTGKTIYRKESQKAKVRNI